MAFPLFAQGAFTASPNDTPDTIARKRAYIAAMMPKFGSARYVGEGIGHLATGILVGRQNKKLDAAESEGRKSAEEQFNRLFGTANSAGSPDVQGPLSVLGMTPAEPAPPRDPNSPDAIAADAMSALGKINPSDREILAKTLMAEAGGEGYGGMLAAGAVIDNRRKSGGYGDGWEGVIMKPGQFSAWNGVTGYAGGEGALNMSSMTPSEEAYAAADAILTGNYEDPTGGATHYYNPAVADPKWGMDAGGDWQRIGNHVFGFADAGRAPSGSAPASASSGTAASAPTSAPAIPINELYMALQNPWLSDAQRGLIGSMIEEQQQASDPLRQLELRKAEIELAQLENPTQQPPEDFTARMFTLNSLGIDPQSEEGKVYLMTGQLPEPPKATPTPMTPEQRKMWGIPDTDTSAYFLNDKGEPEKVGGGGVTVNNNTGIGVEPLGTEGQILVPDPSQPSGYRVELAPGSKLDQERKAAEEKAGKKSGNAATASEVVTTAAERALAASRERAFGGFGQGLVANLPWTDSAEVARQVDTLKANAKIDNLQAMRDASQTGGALGSVTEGETQMLAAKSGALDPSSPNFERDLADYTRTLLRVVHGPEQGDMIFAETWKGAMPPDAMQPTSSGDAATITNDAEYDALPSGAIYVGPDGVKRRKP